MSEYNIKVELEKKTYVFLCPEDQDIISAAKANGIDLPSSCCSGVCTSCASMVIDGSVEQEDAMGLNDDCLLYTSPSPRDRQKSRMPSSA